MERNVKGTFFQEYVRMIRKSKDVDWEKHLSPAEMEIVNQIIIPSQWYPAESYLKLGLAVFKEIGQGSLEACQVWGRMMCDEVAKTYLNLIDQEDPSKTLEKFMTLQKKFIDFDVVQLEVLGENKIRITLDLVFAEEGHAPYANQLYGTFQRMIELSGDKQVKGVFVVEGWEKLGGKPTVIEFEWS